MMRWIERIMNWLNNNRSGNKKSAGNQKATITKLIVLAMIGVALLAGSRVLTGNTDTKKADSQQVFSNRDSKSLSEIKSNMERSSFSSIEKYESYVNQNLKDILEQIQGVSDVSVMVTFSSTEKKIYQNNIRTQDNQTVETDPRGGTRQVNERNQDSEVVMIDKDGSKEPVVIGQEEPVVRGVIVVARGADQPVVKVQIMEAVATVLDIPTYKVKVLQKSE
ncbi:stage III sporulation protein AG [Sporolactobacillus sp. THM7-4]|nr:stage III sporulation protein AG [Sporolactobacillus sp. THM7-4]